MNSEGLGTLTKVFFVTQPRSMRACRRDMDGKNLLAIKKGFNSSLFYVFLLLCIIYMYKK